MAQQRASGPRPGGCQGNCPGARSAGRPGGCKGGCPGARSSQRPGGCQGGCSGARSNQRPGGCQGGCSGARSGPRPGGCQGGCSSQRLGAGPILRPASPKPLFAPKRPAGGPSRGPTPGAIDEGFIKNAIGNPIGPMFGKLLSARELRLEPQQREALGKLAQGCGQRVGHMQQRVIQAIKGMNREQRAANARKIVGGARAAMQQMAGEVRKGIFSILKPQQRETAARILGPQGSSGKPGPKCSGRCGGKCPKCRAGAKNVKPSGCKGKCGGKCPKCRAGAKARKPSPCKGKCGGKCPKCRAGARGNEGDKPKAGPSGQQPNRTNAPAPAPRPGGCGGCRSGRNPGIVMSEQGDCKTKDF